MEIKKTLKFEVEVTIPSGLGVHCLETPFEEQSEEFKKNFVKNWELGVEEEITKFIKEKIPSYFKDSFDDGDLMECYYLENYETMEDYNLSIKVKEIGKSIEQVGEFK